MFKHSVIVIVRFDSINEKMHSRSIPNDNMNSLTTNENAKLPETVSLEIKSSVDSKLEGV